MSADLEPLAICLRANCPSALTHSNLASTSESSTIWHSLRSTPHQTLHLF